MAATLFIISSSSFFIAGKGKMSHAMKKTLFLRFPIRSYTNLAVQPQRMSRGFKLSI